jgi:hypothetical protein
MNLFLDSFWRAVAYCLRPRVVALSFFPLLLTVGLALGLGYFYWDAALDAVRQTLESFMLLNRVWAWLHKAGADGLKMVLAPLIVIFAVTPVIVVLSLLTVALLMTPALTSLVADRRFPTLERKRGASLGLSLWWSLSSTLLAFMALLISIPLWLLPPLILLLPPLIWGWLTYRVMAFDALAEHASKEERKEIFRRHRGWLMGIGVRYSRAIGNLDLHAGFCLFFALVRTLLSGCFAGFARRADAGRESGRDGGARAAWR